MSAGAAYGNGIYFANQLGTSWNYMQAGTVWPLSRYGASLRLAALCEVQYWRGLSIRDAVLCCA